ncbi:MAG: NADH-quinone oxidoreductase subunit [Acidimicrobiaceae bacterium]|nr:NADH-quinone oxidoreductase subunit [Acidimicrobiaceae bacterium]
MSRLTQENVQRARELIALYPETRSALIPILHVAQEQDGWLSPEAIEHVAELVDLTPIEVLGTASFYDMLFTHPVGRHLVSVCTNIACLLNGGYELLEHAERRLGIKAGGTTPDGEFTLEEVECIALCGNAPCLTVNWRFFGDVTNDSFDRLVDDLAAGRRADEVPPHGTLCRVRRSVGLLAGAPGDSAPSQGEAAGGEQSEGEKQQGYGESQPRTAGDVEAAPAHAEAVDDPQPAPDSSSADSAADAAASERSAGPDEDPVDEDPVDEDPVDENPVDEAPTPSVPEGDTPTAREDSP